VEPPARGHVIVGEVGGQLHVVAGYRRTEATGEDRAEVAMAVAPGFEGRGIGTRALELLAAQARSEGVRTFEAWVPRGDRTVVDLFASSGFEVSQRDDAHADVLCVSLGLGPTPAFLDRSAARAREAASASMRSFFEPVGVAVIGVNRERGRIGSEVFHNLLAADCAVPVYPVHPDGGEIEGRQAYARVGDIPGEVDLAVVVVPATLVLDVVEQCIVKGVKALVVISAGFGEVGAEGRALEATLLDTVRQAGVRMVGPNCMGLLNTDPAVRLNATFSPVYPPVGGVAMSTQSGALGLAILDYARQLGLGISTFVSVGNKADVSSNDLIQYWADDPHTRVILLYLESFGNPRNFSQIARRVARVKPIVAVKSGRSSAGVRAASSHTAAMASPDVAVDALFRQTGVIRVDTLDELFDMALLLGAQPLPAGNRVAIVGNSGGPMILATDACVGEGLEVPELSPETQTALRAMADPNAAVTNPVDLVASATPEQFEQALHLVLADDGIDAVILVSTTLFAAPADAVAEVAGRVAASTAKPVVGCFLAAPDLPPLIPGEDPPQAVPVYASPEPAARALGRAVQYGAWRRRRPGTVPALQGCDLDAVRTVVDGHLVENAAGGWLSPEAVTDVLVAMGIPVVRDEEVADPESAGRAAADLGFPVALKAAGEQIVHKSDIGGVALGLASVAEVTEAYRVMFERIGPAMTGALVQQMAAPGVETIVGVVQDPLFGPLLMFGMGGTATELLGDRSFRILPVTDVDADELIRSLRSSPLLFGYRGAPPADADALQDLLHRVAHLAAEVPEMAELDINPVIVSPTGVVAVDARILTRPVAPGPPPDLRRL